ncbi:MAG: hypothetical protein IT359_19750 [Gemmatimonadaceae bacterium]|nr:hypothetical protein [Gemmatimonadaceae bacterium]
MLLRDSVDVVLPTSVSGRLLRVESGRSAGQMVLVFRGPDQVVIIEHGDRESVQSIDVTFADTTARLLAVAPTSYTGGLALGYPSGEVLPVHWSTRSVADRTSLPSPAAVNRDTIAELRPTAIAVSSKRYAIASVSAERGLEVLAVKSGTRTWRVGVLRTLLAEVPRAATIFGGLRISSTESLIAVATDLSDNAYIFRGQSLSVDSVRLTPSRRRGARTDLARRIWLADSLAKIDLLLEPSSAAAAAIVGDSLLAVVFLDQVERSGFMGGEAYLQLAPLAGQVSCGDIAVPGSIFPIRQFALDKGGVLEAVRVISAPRERPIRLRMTRFAIRPEKCSWTASSMH